MHKTADYPAHLVGCALALAVASVAACRQIVDFDEPRQPSNDADAGKLFEPKPYLSSPECTRCIEDTCQVQNAACAADDFCSRWLEGMRKLDGPLIAAPDFYREFLDRAWAFTRGEQGADYQQFAEFIACVDNRCKTACELGRDFSCVDRFDWPARYPKRIELRLHIADRFTATRLDGWRVRACARQILCEPLLGEVLTQDGGFATLGVDLSLAPGVVLPEFYGFLLFDGGTEYPEYPPVQFDQSAPYYDRDFYGSLNPLTRALISSVGENIRLPYDATRGLLMFSPLIVARGLLPASRSRFGTKTSLESVRAVPIAVQRTPATTPFPTQPSKISRRRAVVPQSQRPSREISWSSCATRKHACRSPFCVTSPFVKGTFT